MLTPLSSTSIRLVWNDNSDDEDGFRIERKIGDSGPWVQIVAGLPPNTATYTDSTVSCSTSPTPPPHAYKVFAVKNGLESASNEAGIPFSCDLCGVGGDDDGDGVCDPADVCPGFDDDADGDGDGVPDGCEGGPGALIAPWASGAFTATLESDLALLIQRLYVAVNPSSEAAHVTQRLSIGGEWLQLPPWYSQSHSCAEDVLHELGGEYPDATYHRYLVNADELSELAIVTAYGSDESRMLDIYRTVQRLQTIPNQAELPCWLARVCVAPADCTQPPWSGGELECARLDSATDATVRFGLAFYIAAGNQAFGAAARQLFRQEADAIAAAHLQREYYHFPAGTCPLGRFSGRELCHWVGGGADTADDFPRLVMWIGYYQDVAQLLVAAGTATGDTAYFRRAEDVVEQFLMATESDATTLHVGHHNFRWDLDPAVNACVSHGPLPAPCNEPDPPFPQPSDGVVDEYWQPGKAWDASDASRALWIADVLRTTGLARGEPAGAFYPGLEDWVGRLQQQMTVWAGPTSTCLEWGHDTNVQPLNCSDGHWENGLGVGLFSTLDETAARARLFTALDHFQLATGTWDSQPCLGLFRGVRTIKALAMAIGRDVSTFQPHALLDAGFETGDLGEWSSAHP
ncbi:MAG TPA: hypothetical protein VN923_12640 [Thermoanaerobaculia bacterium]|nr:hypothetical protein [Thermoanaerobaculia bacterium]